jgi:sugar phosphate isomerase/epimerase
MSQMLITANGRDLPDLRSWAERNDFGLELQAFADPATLDGHLEHVLAEHHRALAGFPGMLGVHGAFYDLSSASMDTAILGITRRRYEQNLWIAAELNARYVVFHINYPNSLKVPNMRPSWHRRQVAFWASLVEDAGRLGVTMLLENSAETDPSLLADILAEIGSPWLRACLDVAHATLYSEVPLDEWVAAFEPYLYSCHLNNHDGKLDLHWPLCTGVINYRQVLPRLQGLAKPPLLTLEMASVADMEASLPCFNSHGTLV